MSIKTTLEVIREMLQKQVLVEVASNMIRQVGSA
jgi:hypothetical protein